MASREQRLISAIHLATKKLSSTRSVEETLKEVLELCVQASGAYGGTIYIHDSGARRLRFRHVLPDEVRTRLPAEDIPDDYGVAGRVFQRRTPEITSFPPEGKREHSDIERATEVHVRTMLTVPLMIPDTIPFGIVQLINKQEGVFDENDLAVVETVSAVSALAYVNSLLIEEASRAASLLGMGKVSHDIGNLAAVLQARLNLLVSAFQRTEQESPSQSLRDLNEALHEMAKSVDKIISYSRLISDLSAGRPLRPQWTQESIPALVREAASYFESEARRLKVTLATECSGTEKLVWTDAQFVFRIVQNLVGNALRAVAERSAREDLKSNGKVTVRVRQGEQACEIEVSDTGSGMPPEVVKSILQGTAVSRWTTQAGSGWGTKIVRELTTALKGTLEIDSTPGEGTVFRITLPCHEDAP
jgi:signal transduction histidine kinase